jgi:hypothetical protein
MNKTALTLCCATICLITSCAPSSKQQAQQLLDEATAAYQQGLYNRAQLLLDSLKTQYPSEVEVRRQGLELTHAIQYDEACKTRAYADSMLVVVDAAIAEAIVPFTYQKTEYDDLGRYIYTGSEAEKNLRSYLHAAVDDYGNTQLISSYRGNKSLNHTSVRITATDGTSCTTQPIAYDDAANYHYDIQGARYETVTYTDALDGGVLGFIALHTDQPLTLTYLGGTTPLNVTLTPTDRQALQATYQLADLLKNRLRLMQEQQVATNNVLRLEDKKANAETSDKVSE